MDSLLGEEAPGGRIAGFWRRLCAFVIDGILLGVIGMIAGFVFFDALAGMGASARLIGFAVAMAYFSVCNSRVAGGQTLGKRWLGVRVVDAHGQTLSLPRSLLRYAVLGIPFFVNGLPIDPELAMSPVGYALSLVVFGAIFATIYLYLFNRRTRQSIHDLAVGSYVARVDDAAPPAAFPAIWRGHVVVVALLALLALSLPWAASRLMDTRTFADLLPMYRMLSSQPHVIAVQVNRGWVSGNGNTSHYLRSTLRLDTQQIDEGTMARQFARQMAKGDAEIDQENAVVVVLVYGFDIGIASGWRSHVYSFKPAELTQGF